jgi:hypothetical protein
LRDAIAASGAELKKDMIGIERQANDSLRQSQEREVQAVADMQNAVGRLGAQL